MNILSCTTRSSITTIVLPVRRWALYTVRAVVGPAGLFTDQGGFDHGPGDGRLVRQVQGLLPGVVCPTRTWDGDVFRRPRQIFGLLAGTGQAFAVARSGRRALSIEFDPLPDNRILSEKIISRISDAIISGGLKPGDRLPIRSRRVAP